MGSAFHHYLRQNSSHNVIEEFSKTVRIICYYINIKNNSNWISLTPLERVNVNLKNERKIAYLYERPLLCAWVHSLCNPA